MASDDRLRRFLHLERARPDGPTAEPGRDAPAPVEERISALERPQAPRPAPHGSRTGARLERFGPEPEPTLELADTGSRPFTRCRRCGMDNNLFVVTCTGCTADLDSPEQHEFNERFWLARQAEAEREARLEAERSAQRIREDEEQAHARRVMGEELAREVGRSERQRLGRAFGQGGLPGSWSPLGLRLGRYLPDPRWTWPAFGAGVLLAAGMAVTGLATRSIGRFLAGVALLLALLLHVPD
jgi:hypothetical protein